MHYRFGCAAPLYTDRRHPRLLLGPDDLHRLKHSIRRGRGKIIMASLRRRVRHLTDALPPTGSLAKAIAHWGITGANNGLGAKVMLALDDMALVAVLDEDPALLATVRRLFRAILEVDQAGQAAVLAIGATLLWNTPLAYDLVAERLAEEERRAFTAWMIEARIRKVLAESRQSFFANSGANTPLAESACTALLLALTLQGEPGAPDLQPEIDALLLRLQASLHTAFGPEGYPTEDIGYGTSVLAGLAYSVEAVRRAGLYDAYADCPRWRKTGEALLHFIQPWGEQLCNTGDYVAMFPNRNFVLARLAGETRNPTLLWLLNTLSYPGDPHFAVTHDPAFFMDISLGRGLRVAADAYALFVQNDLAQKPVPPAKAGVPTAFMDPGRGLVSFRSGWDPNDTLVLLDGSHRTPSAQGHMHASCGHFTLSALGEYFAIDTGRYSSEQSEHNVVLIDGHSGHTIGHQWGMSFQHGNLTDYRPAAFCDSAAVDSSHQHNCFWARRRLGLVKGPPPRARPNAARKKTDAGSPPAYVWIVEDINKANDWAAFWWTLNTPGRNTIELCGDHAVVHGFRGGHCLDIHFVLPSPESYPRAHTLSLTQDINACQATAYVGDLTRQVERLRSGHDDFTPEDAVLVRRRLIAQVTGYNGRFLSLLLPRRKDHPPARVERVPTLDNALAVKIVWAQQEDTLIFAYEHHLLEANGVSARGQWCVVRRARKTGRVLAAELGHGTRLTVDGTILRV